MLLWLYLRTKDGAKDPVFELVDNVLVYFGWGNGESSEAMIVTCSVVSTDVLVVVVK